MTRALALTLGLTAPCPVLAFDLLQPITCTLGDTCYIQNYADDDPGPATRDFTCGPLSYDGHDGTDFALLSLAAQAAGVDVLAAAAGTVRGVRDEMADQLQGSPGAPDVTGRECGNGLVITHPDGWETQYCHMALGSLAVRPGDLVAAGQMLGRVGLSGQTEFPHVHLTLRHNGTAIDPFDPLATATCGPAADTLWSTPIPYVPGGLIAVGFADAVPAYDAVKSGTAAIALTSASPALVLWAFLYGGRAGDQVTLTVTGPSGIIVDHAEPLDRTQAQLFRAAGLRAPPGGWPAGEYDGTARLIRDGAVIDSLTQSLHID